MHALRSITVLLAALAAKEGEANVDYASFETGEIHCVIGNNSAMGKHAQRYNGLFSIVSRGTDESPFVEAYAGLNLEHYFDARPRPSDSNILFEPRVAPMSFRRVDGVTAELHQPATPYYGVESWTRFFVREPHYVDMEFRCIPHKDDFQGGFFGVFWASYINAPHDKSIYFLGEGSSLEKPQWVQLCTQRHGAASSVYHEVDTAETPFEGADNLLYASPSLLRYSAPFYYGRFRDRVLIYIFEPGPVVRFAHSPSGGGRTPAGDAANPAWDFQLIVPDYQVGQEYGLKMRFIYKPWAGREDVLREVKAYLGARP